MAWRERNRERLRVYKRSWYASHVASESDRGRLKKYGVTRAVFDGLMRSQRKRCAICLSERVTDVDHDHVTKKVRGLLCNKCNVGLGSFMDDPRLLRAAARYLVRHRKDPEGP